MFHGGGKVTHTVEYIDLKCIVCQVLTNVTQGANQLTGVCNPLKVLSLTPSV